MTTCEDLHDRSKPCLTGEGLLAVRSKRRRFALTTDISAAQRLLPLRLPRAVRRRDADAHGNSLPCQRRDRYNPQ